MKAVLVRNSLANWNADARLYRVDPALDGYHYLVVECWSETGIYAPEAHIYASMPNGGAVPHPGGGLSPQRRYLAPMTHEDALAEVGYSVDALAGDSDE